jgi:hypothetical protein
MKKLFFLLVLPLFVAVCAQAQTASTTTANPNAPVAKWDKMVNDFGDIAFGVPKAAEFTVTNNGKEPLVIASVQTSCGCTSSNWTQEPILPGKSQTISATYNAASQGVFTKTITIKTNADPNPVVLQIKGNVLAQTPPPPPPAPGPAPAKK